MATPAPVTSEASSSAIDERRAQQLMERALTLAERGDQQSAVLSCRQAVSLAPESPQAHSMLGLLLERSGDAAGAIAAYEKVLQFAPDSQLERESLSRLRATLAQRRTVHEPLRSSPVQDSATASTPALSSPPVFDFERRAAAPVTATAASGTAATAPVANAAAAPVPSMPISTTMPMPGVSSTGAAGAGVVIPPASSATSWQKLRQRPSTYFRSAPLAATAALSVLFLLWAQYSSASRALNSAPPAMAGTIDELPPSALKPPSVDADNRGNRNTGQRSTPVPVNPGSTMIPTNPVAGTAARPGAPARSTPASSTPTTVNPVPDAPRPTASTPQASADADGGRLTTRPAPVAAPAQPSGASPVAPAGTRTGADDTGDSDTGRSSTRGGPLGPGSSPGRSYVRVSPAGTSPVARPENRAASDERAAGNDAQSGRPAAAIERLTQAIDSGGPDVALRFQQRAQLYFQSGDSWRAISDFQAAISAYNDMLARGDRVAIARSGIAACRRGIQMAQARLQQQSG